MWLEILCGLVVYKLFRRFFFCGDDVLDVETSDSNALFSVASSLEKLHGGKAFVGLRIPDPDTASRQNIDLVLISPKGEGVVISVMNLAGFVTVDPADGSWSCISDRRHKSLRFQDPVAQTRREASILEAYLHQRGISLPHGYFSCQVILPNPKFCDIGSNQYPPEVITYEQWAQLKKESKNVFSSWFKGTFRRGQKEMQESVHQQLSFALSTAPMWDRLELKGNKFVLGEFIEFKGKQEDLLILRNVRRSKIGRLVIQKTSMFGLAPSNLQVLYFQRDYRSEGASDSESVEVTVRSNTEIYFQPQNSGKPRRFKLGSVISMSLSA